MPEPPPGSLCPFMGGVPVPIVDQKSIIANPNMNPLEAIQTGVAFQACQGDRCALWNAGRGACSMRLAADAQVDAAAALADLKVLLAPLGSFFQSRG